MSKLPRVLLASVAALLASTTAHAEGPTDGIDPLDTAEGAMPMGPTDDLPGDLGGTRGPQLLGEKIMYVNFDGQQMNSCNNNDPQQNCSTIFGGTVLPYSGDAAKRAAIVQIVRRRVEDFGVTITDLRPGAGDYDMEMVGNWQNVENPGFAGVAPSIDCFDQRGGETSFTLEGSGSSDGVAEVILQEIAHTWGLEHIDDRGDLLYPTTEGQNKVFTDECLTIVRLENDGSLTPVTARCNAVHTEFCPSNSQNSYQELLMLFGPSVADTIPPTVEILSPTEGETVDGTSFEMRVRFEDNQSPIIINANILIESAALEMSISEDGAYAGPSELDFPINGLPGGEYTITISATDEDDNPTTDSVSFTVEGEPAGGEEGGEESGEEGGGSGGQESGASGGQESGTSAGGTDSSASGETGDGSGNDDDDDDDDDGDTDGPGLEGTDEGCGCHAPAEPPLGFAAVGLLGLALVRRRRSH